MNKLHIASIASAVLLLVFVMTAVAGGWAVVTFQSMPEYLVAGRPVALTFLVRQHGHSLSDGLNASLSASTPAGLSVKSVVTPTGSRGEYKAVLSVPEPGDWTIKFDPGSFAEATLLPIKAIRPDSPAPPALSQVARGEQLFVAKGCITCHVNNEVAVPNTLPAGPELTGRKFPADFLKQFLADPAKTKGKAPTDTMPNLNLSKDEINAVEAFINRDRPIVSAKAR
jgi:mono/diheme cytochrome c family protein